MQFRHFAAPGELPWPRLCIPANGVSSLLKFREFPSARELSVALTRS